MHHFLLILRVNPYLLLVHNVRLFQNVLDIVAEPFNLLKIELFRQYSDHLAVAVEQGAGLSGVANQALDNRLLLLLEDTLVCD